MKGLLIKDFYCLKQNMKSIFVVLLVFCVVFIPQGGAGVSPMIVMLFTMMVITTLSYDSMSKWDSYALTMPLTRKMLVRSKYILLLIMLLFSLVLAALVCFIGSFFSSSVNMTELSAELGAVAMVALILGSILLPLIYKFGVERARIFLTLVVAVPTAIILIGGSYLQKNNISLPMPDGTQLAQLLILAPVVTAVIFIASYFLSVHIYQKKEL